MNNFNKILLVIDHKEKDQPALVRAMQMHHAPHTEITLFSNVYNSSIESSFVLDPTNLDAVKQSMIDYQAKKLKNLAVSSKVNHVHFKVEVVWQESAYISELNMVDGYQPDLVMKSCRVQSPLTHWLFNSMCTQLLKACPCPVLFVKNEFFNTTGAVLAAVDPGHKLSQTSQLDNNILLAGHNISTAFGITLHACHCFDPGYWEIFLKSLKSANIWTDVFPAAPQSDNRHVLDELREQQYKMFTEASEEFVPHVENRHFINGDIADEIPELASKLNASIVVLGTTYRTGFLGSSAEKILETVEVDLLVVKPSGFDSPFSLSNFRYREEQPEEI